MEEPRRAPARAPTDHGAVPVWQPRLDKLPRCNCRVAFEDEPCGRAKKMILRFHNFEAAALAVAKLRDDGYFARVCDESVAALWGPGAVGGLRVIVSDEPIEDEIESLPSSMLIEAFLRFGRMVVAGLWTFLGISLGLIVLRAAVSNPLGFAISVAIYGLAAGVVLFGGALLSISTQRIFADSVLRDATKSNFAGDVLIMLVVVVMLARVLIFS